MPVPALYPLPANPTTGQPAIGAIGSRGVSSVLPATASGGSGGVNREVLKGLQDVAWSDDEDDPDCLLCAEPLDLSDLNFKPCQCGMQICQFCYNKLLQTDARCPGCRRTYDAKSVIFQPVDFEEVKRAKEKKTKRARIIKQLDAMGRRHLLGVRIVMKNMVYVVGMKLPAPGDDAIPILRSNEYFGQYGKIAKLYLRDRTATSSTSVTTLTPDNPSTSTGIYIVYVRREDAARAISSLDGIQAPSGPPGQILKASYGTTRYCDSFLRSQKCDTTNCHNLHEWGGEGDAFTKDDLETALTKPVEYDARQKQVQMQPPALTQKAAWPKPMAEESSDIPALPRTASWGVRPAPRSNNPRATPPIGAARPTKIASNLIPLGGKNNAAFPLPSPSPVPIAIVKEEKKKKTAAGTAMSRGRSGSSTQSTAPSSNPASPKRKNATLPPVQSAKTILPPVSLPTEIPTEVPLSFSPQSSSPIPTNDIVQEPEAGPSTISKPTERYEEPYPVHSPFPDFVDIFAAPPADDDAGFVMHLAIDDKELERHLAESRYSRFSPFDRVFEELPELGVSVSRALGYPLLAPRDQTGYVGMFDPFSSNSPVDLESSTASEEQAGRQPIANDGEENEPPLPRTSSRFNFARRQSVSTTGRGQSPFNARMPVEELSNGWLGRNPASVASIAQGQYGDDLRQGDRLAPHSTGFVGSHGSSVENGWGGDYSPSYNRQPPGYSYGNERNERDRRQEQMAHLKSRVADRDDYDPAMTMLQFGPGHPSQYNQQPQQRMLFSPEGGMPMHQLQDESYHYIQFNAQNQQTPPPHQTQTPDHMSARLLQQIHQRATSPSPMSSSHDTDLVRRDPLEIQRAADKIINQLISQAEEEVGSGLSEKTAKISLSDFPALATLPTSALMGAVKAPVKVKKKDKEREKENSEARLYVPASDARRRPSKADKEREAVKVVEKQALADQASEEEVKKHWTDQGVVVDDGGQRIRVGNADMVSEDPIAGGAVTQASTVDRTTTATKAPKEPPVPPKARTENLTPTEETSIHSPSAIGVPSQEEIPSAFVESDETNPPTPVRPSAVTTPSARRVIRLGAIGKKTEVSETPSAVPGTISQAGSLDMQRTTSAISTTSSKNTPTKSSTPLPSSKTTSRRPSLASSNTGRPTISQQPAVPIISHAENAEGSKKILENNMKDAEREKEKRKPGGKYAKLVEPAPKPIEEHAGFAPRKKEKAYKPPVIRPAKVKGGDASNDKEGTVDSSQDRADKSNDVSNTEENSVAQAVPGVEDDLPLGDEDDADDGGSEDMIITLPELVAHITDTVDPAAIGTFFRETTDTYKPVSTDSNLYRQAVETFRLAESHFGIPRLPPGTEVKANTIPITRAREVPGWESWIAVVQALAKSAEESSKVSVDLKGYTERSDLHLKSVPAYADASEFPAYHMEVIVNDLIDSFGKFNTASHREAASKYSGVDPKSRRLAGYEGLEIPELETVLRAFRQEEMALSMELGMAQRENLELWQEAKTWI